MSTILKGLGDMPTVEGLFLVACAVAIAIAMYVAYSSDR